MFKWICLFPIELIHYPKLVQIIFLGGGTQYIDYNTENTMHIIKCRKCNKYITIHTTQCIEHDA
jgi:Fe2+ or Zn2+ uptake regulation protein